MSDQRDQFAEHLKFFAELGVAGYRKDAIWAARKESGSQEAGESGESKESGESRESRESRVQSPTSAASTRNADLPPARKATADHRSLGEGGQVGRDSAAQLAAIREDIGECVRCKLCTLGRK